MLFIGVLKEADGVDALTKVQRQELGKGVKGLHMYFMPSWLMHSSFTIQLCVPEFCCS